MVSKKHLYNVIILSVIWFLRICFHYFQDHMGGVVVSVLASSVVDRGFKSWLGQTKEFKIGICYFSVKHAVSRKKSKDWLARNQDNVS